MLTRSRGYTLVLLKEGPNRKMDGVEAVIWEHGRGNFQLREDGVLAIVCPVMDASPWSGIGIFNATPDQTAEIMEGDPEVKAGVFEYEIHLVRSFPGDALPGWAGPASSCGPGARGRRSNGPGRKDVAPRLRPPGVIDIPWVAPVASNHSRRL